MTFLTVLALAAGACFLLSKPLRRFPAAFYAVAVVASILFIASSYVDFPRSVGGPLFVLMRKCTLPLALFCIVMFVGVLPEKSKAKRVLRPIRAQLSIVAWILSLGHMVVYAVSYAPRMVGSAWLETHMVASLAVAAVLFALLLVLGITSFNAVKSRMDASSWSRVQRWAYAFFGLAYAHVLLALAPSALNDGTAAQSSIAAYSAVFVSYAVLRLYRARKDGSSGMRRLSSG